MWVNIKRAVPNGKLPSSCNKKLEISISAKRRDEKIIFTLANDFFVSEEKGKIMEEISKNRHINNTKNEKGLSFNERLLESIGSDTKKQNHSLLYCSKITCLNHKNYHTEKISI